MAVNISNDIDLVSVEQPGQTEIVTIQVPGIQGPPPNIIIGTVTTGAPGSNASATLTGPPPNYALNLTIPRGAIGEVSDAELAASSEGDRAYVRSFAATDLVANGTAYLGNNTNFSQFTLDKTDSPVGGGSFDTPVGVGGSFMVDELIPVDLSRRYLLRFFAKQKAPGVVSYMYGFLAPYDIAGSLVAPENYQFQNNTTTTLAAALKPGDTEIQLTSAANWNNAATAEIHLRRAIVWNYTDDRGKTWPVETFSRRVSPVDLWADGGINGNIITLRAPFDPVQWGYLAGYTIPAGTSLSNGSAGGTYMYGLDMSNKIVNEAWTSYEAPFSGGQYAKVNGGRAASADYSTGFPPGTAFVKVGWLANLGPTAVGQIAGSHVSIAAVSLSDATRSEYELKSATRDSVPGTIVKRDGNGDVIFNNVFAGNVADTATVLTRKDYVDTEVAKKITAFADPNADRIVFWDDSAGAWAALTASTGLSISGTSMTVVASSETVSGRVELATAAETTTGTDNTRAVHPAGLKVELDKKAALVHTHGVTDLTATGTKEATTFLRGDNTWAVPPGGAGGGTVTSANITDATVVGRSVLTAADAPAARTAIGAGTSSLVIGTTAGTAAAGDDTRLSDARTPTAHTHPASQISDSTVTGRSVVTAVDAAAARTVIGAGTSSLALGTTSTTAKAGNYQPTSANISDSTAVGRSVLIAVDAAAARTAIGAGTSSLAIGTTAGTAAAGDDNRIVGASQRALSKRTITAAYTLVAADAVDMVLHSTSASAVTITLPQDSAATIAQEIAIPWRQFAAGQITFAAGTGATLISRGSVFKSAGQNAEGLVTKVAANTWLLSGDISA